MKLIKFIIVLTVVSCAMEAPPTVPTAPIPTPEATETLVPTITPTVTRTATQAIPTTTVVPIATRVITNTVTPTVTHVPTTIPTATATVVPIATVTPTVSASGLVVRNVYLTFYGYDDNDDGNGNYGNAIISDPTIHSIATEDLGTYDHPSTFATDYVVAKSGEIIYVPKLHKYYIMEDTCVECSDDRKAGKTRIDLYMGGNTALQGNSLSDCESTMTADPFTDIVITSPSNNWPVATAPLYDRGVCPGITFPYVF